MRSKNEITPPGRTHARAANRLTAAAATRTSTVTDMANVLDQSPHSAGLDGLLHCADSHRPRAVRARAAAHHRRRIVDVRITEHPTAAWTAQQIVEAFPNDMATRWLVRDRDLIYGGGGRLRRRTTHAREHARSDTRWHRFTRATPAASVPRSFRIRERPARPARVAWA